MGAFFQWDPAKFTVHVDAMDQEHQTLIAIMNELHARHGAGAPAMEIRTIIERLGAFTSKHFADEERYLESIAFPGLSTHRLIHKDLLSKFGEHVAAFDRTRVLGEEFFRFLSNWLKAHIQGIDRKYGEFATGKKVA